MSVPWMDQIPVPTNGLTKHSRHSIIRPLGPKATLEAALVLLHDHRKMFFFCPILNQVESAEATPRASPEDRSRCTWYRVTERLAYLPGGIAATESHSIVGCFDLPNGLEVNSYASAGVEIRNRWTVGKINERPRDAIEADLDPESPALCLREDTTLQCNVLFHGYTRRNLKKANEGIAENFIETLEKPQQDLLKQDEKTNPTPPSSHGQSW